MWRIREDITPGLLDDGCCYKYDISLPLTDYYKVVEIMRERLKPVTTRVVAYGHVGDGLSGVCVLLKPCTHRRRDATVELSRVGGVYWVLAIVLGVKFEVRETPNLPKFDREKFLQWTPTDMLSSQI